MVLTLAVFWALFSVFGAGILVIYGKSAIRNTKVRYAALVLAVISALAAYWVIGTWNSGVPSNTYSNHSVSGGHGK